MSALFQNPIDDLHWFNQRITVPFLRNYYKGLKKTLSPDEMTKTGYTRVYFKRHEDVAETLDALYPKKGEPASDFAACAHLTEAFFGNTYLEGLAIQSPGFVKDPKDPNKKVKDKVTKEFIPTGEWEDVKRNLLRSQSSDPHNYLLVTENGYYCYLKLLGAGKQLTIQGIGKQLNRMRSGMPQLKYNTETGKYERDVALGHQSALGDLAKRWDGTPFVFVELSAKGVDCNAFAVSTSFHHVWVNGTSPYALDLSYLLTK